MSVERVLMLKLLGDTSSIDKSLKKSQGRIRGFASSVGSWTKAAGIGLAIEGVEKLGETLGDAWTGFREGEKASAQLGTTWRNLGLDGSQLQGVIDDISASTLKLGTDDTEAIKAYNTALQNTGGNSAAAMRRLKIAQDLVANGSAPNLQSALKLIDRAGSGSAATVRKFGLTADTAKGRIKELGEKVKGASEQAAKNDPFRVFFNAFNEGLEGAIGSLSSGDLQGALASLTGIGTAASAAWTAVFPAVDKAMTGLIGEETWGKIKTVAQGALDGIAGTVERLGRIWDGLAPHVQNALNLISPLIGGLMTIVGIMGDNIRLVLDAIGALLNGDFSGAWTAVQGVVSNVGVAITAAVTAVQTFLQGILPGIQEAARKIGEGIFQGIVTVVGGLADAVRGIFNSAVEALRTAWNSLDFYIPPFTIPGIDKVVVPDPLGGSGFEVFGGVGPTRIWEGSGDLIPDLAQGGVIRRRPGGMLARIGEGRHDEAVIPLDRAGIGGNTIHVTINVNVAPGGDLVQAGRQIVEAIRQYERRSGAVWRSA